MVGKLKLKKNEMTFFYANTSEIFKRSRSILVNDTKNHFVQPVADTMQKSCQPL